MRPTFIGDSCFPISPQPELEKLEGSEINLSSQDQLIKIIEGLGPDCKDDSFLHSKNQRSYLTQMTEGIDFETNKDVLKKLHDKIDKDLLAFLSRCLVFNPNDRSSVDDLLGDAIFEHIRNPDSEMTASKKMAVAVDHLPINDNTGETEDYTVRKMK